MNTLTSALSVIALTAIAFAGPAIAPAVAQSLQVTSLQVTSLQAALTPAQEEDVLRAESYLNGLKTMRADFIQTAQDGRWAGGTFYLSRPGRLRFEYEDPIDDFIVADGTFIFYWDGELEQQSNALIGRTLADFILREDIALTGDITVTGVDYTDTDLRIRVVETDEPDQGELTLVFDRDPFRLVQWTVVDGEGGSTTVELFNPRIGVALDRDLFFFRDPSIDPNAFPN